MDAFDIENATVKRLARTLGLASDVEVSVDFNVTLSAWRLTLKRRDCRTIKTVHELTVAGIAAEIREEIEHCPWLVGD